MSDIIDIIDGLHAKAKQADADLETADIEDSHVFLSISQRHHEFQDAMLNAWPAISARLREAERKARAFDLIASGEVIVRHPFDQGRMSDDWEAMREWSHVASRHQDLLTAIEAAIAAGKETT